MNIDFGYADFRCKYHIEDPAVFKYIAGSFRLDRLLMKLMVVRRIAMTGQATLNVSCLLVFLFMELTGNEHAY